MIAEALEKVGKDGVITVEESQTFGMELDLVEGMRFDKGYISPYFVTDPERMEAVLDDAYILLVRRAKISAVKDLLPVLEKVMQSGKPARDHRRGRRGRGARHARRQQDPRHVQVGRHQGPRLRRAPQGDAPGHGDPHRRPGHLRGGRPQAREHRRSTCSAGPARSSSPRTRRRSSRAPARRPTSRAASTRSSNEIDNTDSDYDREKLQERLAKLSGGVAIIKVGAATEVELKEKKHRIEDAVQTTKAAVEEGVVPGGGVALLRAQAKVLELADDARGRRGDRRPDRGPCARRAAQADRGQRRHRGWRRRREGARTSRVPNGLNAATGEYEDLVKAGVIDAAKVTRSALQNAASIAALFLTTEAVVADKPEQEGAGGGMPGGMPGGMDGMGDF